MPNRLDIELTSHREDGTWTWRVAGARQPRGNAESAVVPAGSKVGDLLTVDAEVDLDGITIVAVLPPKPSREASARQAGRATTIPIIGTRNAADQGGVTTTLARPVRDRRSEKPLHRGGEGSRPGRDAGNRPRSASKRESGDRPRGEKRGEGQERLTGSVGRPSRGAPRGERNFSPGTGQASQPSRPDRSRPVAPSVHRAALLDSLSPEQRVVADRLVAGGLPAVRRAIDEQNSQARDSGHPEVPAEPILTMAESLLPRLKSATWCDRAEAALIAAEPLPLRELRTIVANADEAGRDEPGRTLLARLRQAVDTKVAATRAEWEGQITALMADGQTVRALRASSSPPDPGARLGGALASQLAEATSKGLTADTPPPRWILLLEAAAASPVSINVRPEGVPADAGTDILDKARRLAGRVPAVAKLLGLAIPPPPVPIKNRR